MYRAKVSFVIGDVPWIAVLLVICIVAPWKVPLPGKNAMCSAIDFGKNPIDYSIVPIKQAAVLNKQNAL